MMKRIGAIGFMLMLARAAAAQSVADPSLVVQNYFGGLDRPTGVAFLNGFGDALVTQKNDGRVLLFRNRRLVGTALDLPVANNSERGLLSIALSPSFASDQFVYLYHTAAREDGGEPITNKISRYRFVNDRLVFERKIIDLPGGPGPNHNGGKIAFDAKGKLYAVIGDLNRNEQTQNFQTSGKRNRTGAILRLQPNGRTITTNPFYANKRIGRVDEGLNDVYAYGIRNSFGIAFDPVAGDLWDTENGPNRFDEINRVRAGFNSGWQDIMGPTSQTPLEPGSLVLLGEQAHYADPKLTWENPVAPTDLHFYDGVRLGEEYRHDLFVGDAITGSIYRFDLTSNRKSLQLTGPLSDRIVNNTGSLLDESADIVFGSGFGVTTDLLTGPGGLFVLSFDQGTLYRITQNTARTSALGGSMNYAPMSLRATAQVPEPGMHIVVLAACFSLARRATRRQAA